MISSTVDHRFKSLSDSIPASHPQASPGRKCLPCYRAISSEPGLDLAWRREVVTPSARALLSLAVTGREEGLTEIGISQNSLCTMEHGRVEIGRRSCSASFGSLGKGHRGSDAI